MLGELARSGAALCQTQHFAFGQSSHLADVSSAPLFIGLLSIASNPVNILQAPTQAK